MTGKLYITWDGLMVRFIDTENYAIIPVHEDDYYQTIDYYNSIPGMEVDFTFDIFTDDAGNRYARFIPDKV